MHILLTNDDGYQAPGIARLAKTLMEHGHRVTVSAPDSERSAASHGISITVPLRAREISVEGAAGWAISGTPADSARLGLYLMRDDAPDICISGINQGSNLGGACIYSGTVNAAMEASMAGCPAIAVSLASFTDRNFAPAAEKAAAFLDYAVSHPLKRGEIYNINVPAGDNLRDGFWFTQTMGPDYLTDARYEKFVSDYDNTYYFLDDGDNLQFFPPDSDTVKCSEGETTVSVLTWDIAAKGEGRFPAQGKMEI